MYKIRVLIVISMFQPMIQSSTNFLFWKKENHHHSSAENKFQDPQGISVTSHSIKPYLHGVFAIQTYLGCSLFSKSTVRDWQLIMTGKWKWSHSVISDSLQPLGLHLTMLLCPWDFPGKNSGVGCHFLLWRIFPTQGLKPGLLNWRQTICHLSHQGRCNNNIQQL